MEKTEEKGQCERLLGAVADFLGGELTFPADESGVSARLAGRLAPAGGGEPVEYELTSLPKASSEEAASAVVDALTFDHVSVPLGLPRASSAAELGLKLAVEGAR